MIWKTSLIFLGVSLRSAAEPVSVITFLFFVCSEIPNHLPKVASGEFPKEFPSVKPSPPFISAPRTHFRVKTGNLRPNVPICRERQRSLFGLVSEMPFSLSEGLASSVFLRQECALLPKIVLVLQALACRHGSQRQRWGYGCRESRREVF